MKRAAEEPQLHSFLDLLPVELLPVIVSHFNDLLTTVLFSRVSKASLKLLLEEVNLFSLILEEVGTHRILRRLSQGYTKNYTHRLSAPNFSLHDDLLAFNKLAFKALKLARYEEARSQVDDHFPYVTELVFNSEDKAYTQKRAIGNIFESGWYESWMHKSLPLIVVVFDLLSFEVVNIFLAKQHSWAYKNLLIKNIKSSETVVFLDSTGLYDLWQTTDKEVLKQMIHRWLIVVRHHKTVSRFTMSMENDIFFFNKKFPLPENDQ